MQSYQAGETGEGSVSKIGVIKANPEQSKHLETATMKVCGCDIDFTGLRCEEYASDSRIPTVTLGTPEQVCSYARPPTPSTPPPAPAK